MAMASHSRFSISESRKMSIAIKLSLKNVIHKNKASSDYALINAEMCFTVFSFILRVGNLDLNLMKNNTII